MSYSAINRVVLVGRLTREPQLAALPSGVAVCELRVACDAVRRSPEGEYERKPNFFTVRVYGRQAEVVGRYMDKGGRLALEGRLDWHEWTTPEGQRREAVEILADRVEFLDGPDRRQDGEGAEEGEGAEAQAEQEREGDLVF